MRPGRLRRRLHQAIMFLAALAVAGALGLLIGAWHNDRVIAEHPARSLGEITRVGVLRTDVEYRDSNGLYHSPGGGLLYPGGLAEGQVVRIVYAQHRPDLAKVEGRNWPLAIAPAASIAAAALAIAAGAWLAVNALTSPPPTPRPDQEDS
ncbi:DUF3592 domain-containing protein [Corynebacterium otitidis]|uniref:Putative secreted protein n=1 Tax=Corynebacterium otitidis ATCC 51513 TaxID=883169 RepID=I7KK50_9CORY|nr:DUF3592 domain-containing protein [Corynebacterium otitidis]EJZ81541.1 hypothetical protein HMPREF9719_01584 [Corynebacterium otitidis ATCC 51513]KKO84036.1 membrane protein [Corynebacterium otitidis]CCI84120.1 putative secreted protein [Corynebacterium otitidis ATCC 51513]